MANSNGKRRANNRTGKRQASKGSRAKAASAPSPKRKGLSQDVVDNAKRQVIHGDRVGHKNPPKETRFRKGQSGNPKGRPKKKVADLDVGAESMNAMVLKEAARLVRIREGDETKEVPAVEAVLRSEIVSASKGNSYAQRNFIDRVVRAEGERQREIKKRIEIWEEYIEKVGALFALAEKNGEPPPTIRPHPDDVIIDYEKGVRIIGPIDEEEEAKLAETIKLRDLHFMQHVLEERLCYDLDGPDRLGTALVFAIVWNNGVPPRLRLAEIEIDMRMWRLRGIPKRQLLKTLYRAWREIGAPRPRGWTYPPQQWAARFLAVCRDMGTEILRGEGDGSDYLEPMCAVLIEGFGRKKAA